MSLHPVARKRLLILSGVVALVVATAAGLWTYRTVKQSREIARIYVDGMSSAEAGDHERAVMMFGGYLHRRPDDVEVIRTYLTSLDAHDTDNAAQDLRARIAGRRHLLRYQNDEAVRYELLELFRQANLIAEARAAAEERLARDPADAPALQTLAWSLERLKQPSAAADAARRWAAASHDDPDARLTHLRLASDAGVDTAGLLRLVDESTEDADPMAYLLAGAVYLTAARDSDGVRAQPLLADAVTAFGNAAEKDSPSPQFTLTLVRLMEQAERFDDARRYLLDAHASRPSPETAVAAARRAFFARDAAGIDVPGLPDSPETYVLRASAARWQGDAQAVETWEQKLLSDASPSAGGWVAAVVPDEAARADEVESVLRRALRRDDSALLVMFFGEMMAGEGSTDKARDAFLAAANAEPAWDRPRLALGLLSLAADEPAAAMYWSAEAAKRAPGQLGVVVQLVRSWARAIDAGLDDRRSTLLQLVSELHEQQPGEPQTLAIYADLLAAAGRTQEAADVSVSAVIAGAGRDTLLALVDVCRRRNLSEIEARLLDDIRTRFGVTPPLAFSDALRRASADDVEAALAQFEVDRAAVDPDRTDPQWSLTRAGLTEHLAPQDAPLAWREASAAHPSVAEVQRAVLTSPSAQRDNDLASAALTRLGTAAGQNDNLYRVTRARRLLATLESTDAQRRPAAITEALRLVDAVTAEQPDHAEAHLLAAFAHERSGRTATAIDRMSTAVRIAPQNKSAAIQLAGLLQSSGDFARANVVLDRLAASPPEASADRRQLAVLLGRHGRSAEAAALLGETALTGSPEDQLLLADLHARRGDAAEAGTIIEHLLARPDLNANVSLAATRLAADLAAAGGDEAAYTTALARFETLRADPGMREVVLAEHYLTVGNVAGAREVFVKATEAAPDNPGVWRGRMLADLTAGDADAASSTLDAALSAVGDDPGLRQIAGLRALMHVEGPAGRVTTPLFVALLRDPLDPATAETGRLFSTERVTPQQVEALVRRHPRSEAVRLTQVRYLSGERRHESAADAGAQAMDALPTSSEAARLTVDAAAAARRWGQAIEAARTWKQRGGRPDTADLVVAQAQIELGRSADAVTTLSPYAPAMQSDPDASVAMLTTYVLALVHQRRDADATALLRPLLNRPDAGWRVHWMGVAANFMPGDAAVRWLGQIGQAVSADAHDELTSLAEAWDRLALRTGDQQFARTSREILTQLQSRPNAPPASFVMMAMQHEREGQLNEAEALYREVLRRLEGQPAGGRDEMLVAMNNLAMVLANRGVNLQEAERLSRRTIDARPEIANLHDTLAHVLWKDGQTQAAVDAVDQALTLDPGNPVWLIHKASILLDGGRRDEAVAIVDAVSASPAALPDETRVRLDSLRRRIAGADGGGTGVEAAVRD